MLCLGSSGGASCRQCIPSRSWTVSREEIGTCIIGDEEVGLAVALGCPGSRIALCRGLSRLSGALDGSSSMMGRCSLPSREVGPVF